MLKYCCAPELDCSGGAPANCGLIDEQRKKRPARSLKRTTCRDIALPGGIARAASVDTLKDEKFRGMTRCLSANTNAERITYLYQLGYCNGAVGHWMEKVFQMNRRAKSPS